ncbi:hypothetical protein LRR81_02595 [Metabacillus sp. GX 13764]|uniref:hypothetical protein n=1 Tax=Metabacillus kandeliae TaxID=2900151 RepID=UPI001E42A59F|nr:hypothetical protein [Metabacillus kandeliae]MCD7033103.1 hypothetical protein [Metabacillus kandeliae]
MVTVLIILLAIAIILLAASFFQRDKVKELEQEFEHLQLSAMQEIYKLKKKMRILEEELLQNDPQFPRNSSKDETIDPQLVKKVMAKYQNGMSFEAIAQSENLSLFEAKTIVKNNERVLT